ncbi:alpha/beta hydrolase family protein [Marinomonas gallaica]|uniref:alpha/beta hydrolase family protein n=1 Tax=Marinomonas gallaica TaxID=1806667 RepID=UPI003CE5B91B
MYFLSELICKRLLILLFSSLIFSMTAHAVGFREISTEGVSLSAWYPSETPPVNQRLGPFDVEIAKDAPILTGKHEIVLFSHGYNGFYRNHYLTIQALVNAGYVVVAPQHEADYLLGGSDTAAALNYRYFELSKALNAVIKSSEFSNYVNANKVHGLGYSLGSVSIMLASGATFSSQRYKDYCDQNQSLDPSFCEDPGWIYRLIQSFRHDVVLTPISDSFKEQPLITGKVVLVAPVFQGIETTSKLSMSDLDVIAFDSDSIAIPQYHALPLYIAFSSNMPSEYHVVKGHHYAFIAPFPKWLTEEEDISVAKDPEGFDRSVFLRDLNAKIVEIMTSK